MLRKPFIITFILCLFISLAFSGCKTSEQSTITQTKIIETESEVTVTDFVVFGDLNGNGKDDTAAIIVSDENHYYLDVSENKPPNQDHITKDFLGIEIEIKNISIIEGEISLVMVINNIEVTFIYKLEDNRLIRIE